MAKETEAQALRSGNPVVQARAVQAAAKIRADAEAKLMNSIGTYTKSREEMIRADQLAKKGKGGGAGATSPAMEQLAQVATQPGVTRADVVKAAIKLRNQYPGDKQLKDSPRRRQGGHGRSGLQGPREGDRRA